MRKAFLTLVASLFVSMLSAQTTALQWAKQLGGSDYDAGKAVAIDPSGNVYSTGAFSGIADFDPGPGVFNLTSAGENDIYLSKLDASGNFQWAISMGGPLFDWGQALVVDGSGNIYLTGYIGSLSSFNLSPVGAMPPPNSNYFAVFIAKINTDGQVLWSKGFSGTSSQMSTGIALDGDGFVYTTGNFSGEVDFDPGPGTFMLTAPVDTFDIYISKLNGAGDFVWAKQLGGPGFDFGSALAVDNVGNVFCTGSFSGTADFDPGPGVLTLTSAGANDAFIIRLNNPGNLVWVKQLSGLQDVAASSIAIDATNNIVTSGYFAGQVDFNPDIAVNNLIAAGSYDIYISKLDQNGNFIWAKQLGGVETDAGYSIDLDLDGNIYTTGTFSDIADFNPDLIINNSLSSYGDNDVFLSKLNSDGDFVFSYQIGGSDYDAGYSVIVDAAKNIYTTGQFFGLADMDPDPNSFFAMNSQGSSSDIYLVKLSQTTVGLHEMNTAGFTLYPNPTANILNLNSIHTLNGVSLKLTSVTGQVVLDQPNLSGMNLQLDLTAYSNGLYFLELNDKDTSTRIKILKN